MKPEWNKLHVAKNEEHVLLAANGKEVVSRTKREFERNVRKHRTQRFVDQFKRPIQFKEVATA